MCVPQLLSLRAATTEACMPRARAPQRREATAVRSLCTSMKGSPQAQQRRPNAANK